MKTLAPALLLPLLALSACSRDAPSPPAERRLEMSAPRESQLMVSDQVAAQKADNPYLALEHFYRIELPEDLLRSRFKATVDRCFDDDSFACTLVDANLNEEEHFTSANIQVRIQTAGVEPLISTAARGGDITSQSSRSEDLTKTVMDVEERLAMLRSYRERLQTLEARAADDIESLIKVNSELARVQAEIEQVQANREFLQKRLDLDLLNIHLYSDRRDNILAPISEAFDRFFYTLSTGASSIIFAVAWTLPWLVGLALLAGILRLVWRRRRGR